jgi:hypothetical protein
MRYYMEQSELTATQRMIEHIKGKYVKRVLTQLEISGKLDAEVRKIILDGANDISRDIQKGLGYTVQD